MDKILFLEALFATVQDPSTPQDMWQENRVQLGSVANKNLEKLRNVLDQSASLALSHVQSSERNKNLELNSKFLFHNPSLAVFCEGGTGWVESGLAEGKVGAISSLLTAGIWDNVSLVPSTIMTVQN